MAVTLFGIVVAAGLMPPADRLTGGFVIEFQTIPNFPDANYNMQMEVTVEGHDKKYAPGVGIGVNNGNGMPAEKLADFMAFSINGDDKGWAFERDGARLLIKGWTDPKTGRFHAVKGVKVDPVPIEGALAELLPKAKAMPEKLLPKVTDRRPKA